MVIPQSTSLSSPESIPPSKSQSLPVSTSVEIPCSCCEPWARKPAIYQGQAKAANWFLPWKVHITNPERHSISARKYSDDEILDVQPWYCVSEPKLSTDKMLDVQPSNVVPEPNKPDKEPIHGPSRTEDHLHFSTSFSDKPEQADSWKGLALDLAVALQEAAACADTNDVWTLRQEVEARLPENTSPL